jgi:undecaprenyl-diphosphatase
MANIVVSFLASFLIWIMLFGLLVLWGVDGKIKKEQALHAFFAFAVSWVLVDFLKNIFHTPRPFELNGQPTLTIVALADGAFPSGHAAASFAMALTVWLHDKKIGLLFIVASFLVGIARILANVHYPIDILGGMIIGASVSLILERIHIKSSS